MLRRQLFALIAVTGMSILRYMGGGPTHLSLISCRASCSSFLLSVSDRTVSAGYRTRSIMSPSLQ
jgi:hypothetical protein